MLLPCFSQQEFSRQNQYRNISTEIILVDGPLVVLFYSHPRRNFLDHNIPVPIGLRIRKMCVENLGCVY